jgi:hypothetical protein
MVRITWTVLLHSHLRVHARNRPSINPRRRRSSALWAGGMNAATLPAYSCMILISRRWAGEEGEDRVQVPSTSPYTLLKEKTPVYGEARLAGHCAYEQSGK